MPNNTFRDDRKWLAQRMQVLHILEQLVQGPKDLPRLQKHAKEVLDALAQRDAWENDDTQPVEIKHEKHPRPGSRR